jgi:hypothetical protein
MTVPRGSRLITTSTVLERSKRRQAAARYGQPKSFLVLDKDKRASEAGEWREQVYC